MLAVIPVCHKDLGLALHNLELAKRLDSSVSHDCLIAYEETFLPEEVRSIEVASLDLFRAVHLFRYHSPYETTWPLAPNHVWQNVARHIYHKFRGQSWLWWEADATPLVPRWLDKLEEAHVLGGKQFSGHIVMGMGHMNGVAIYPWNTPELCTHPFLTRHAGWDVALKDETSALTQPLNHLIYHFPRAHGMQVTVRDPVVPNTLKEKGYVLFHGCNDGTLQRLLLGQPLCENGKCLPTADARIFTMQDYGRPIDEGELFWQAEKVKLSKKGWPVARYSECKTAQLSIIHQNPWPTGFFRLESSKQRVHFNSGLTRDDNGNLWLAVRRWTRRSPKDWHSEIVICPLTESMDIKEQRVLPLSGDPFTQCEDPRLIWHDGKFHLSYCQWSQNAIYTAKQIFATFDKDWHFLEDSMPAYGFNDPDALVPEQGGSEKNWVWFNHEGKWHFVYCFMPHKVVEMDDLITHQTEPKLLWKWGEIRGGTPPVRIGNDYLTFFHSSLPWKRRQKRYFMGAYTFQAKPPFAVTAITSEPLLRGNEDDQRILGGPLCVFPSGAVLMDKEWLVTGGLNDELCFWTKIPHEQLLDKLEKLT